MLDIVVLLVKKSNEIRLSSIPKGETPLIMIYYNVEAYSKYMKEYAEYKNMVKKIEMLTDMLML